MNLTRKNIQKNALVTITIFRREKSCFSNIFIYFFFQWNTMEMFCLRLPFFCISSLPTVYNSSFPFFILFPSLRSREEVCIRSFLLDDIVSWINDGARFPEKRGRESCNNIKAVILGGKKETNEMEMRFEADRRHSQYENCCHFNSKNRMSS